jgi:plastocyanin
MRRFASLGSSLALVVLLLAGCGTQTGSTSGSAGPPDTAGGAELIVEGRAFGQAPRVSPGGSFDIVNRDAGAHTFTSNDGAWAQVDLPAGSTVTFAAPPDLAPGVYSFFCAFHPDSMGGRLTVEG